MTANTTVSLVTNDAPRSQDALVDAICAWRTMRAPPYAVVEAAVDALVAGVDSPSLGELAGATHETAAFEVPDLWERVVQELALNIPEPESGDAELRSARWLIRSLMSEHRSSQEIARIIGKEFLAGRDHRFEALRALDSERAITEAIEGILSGP